jgi:hypothetical protein
MRVLLTNNTLDSRAGSELWVRDVALALLRRGHQPIAYSRRLGVVAEELRRLTVPVLSDLASQTEPPDLIHGQHHLETMTALLRFPGVPALYVCHGWLPPEEAPPAFPRLLRYVAVDDLVRERLVLECGIPKQRVTTLRNFVDLARFLPRAPLPAAPRRALLFSHFASDHGFARAVREGCAAAGVRMDIAGISAGAVADRPESLLPQYDVVFAKARSALEAAAVGCFVILCDAAGLGPALTPENLDEARALNLGVRLLRDPIDAEAVAARLATYDPQAAREVQARVRAEAGLDEVVDRLLSLYGEVLAEGAALQMDPHDDLRAAARYLRWGPLRGGETWTAERERLVIQGERLAGERDRLVVERDAIAAERDRVVAELAAERGRASVVERATPLGERVDRMASLGGFLGVPTDGFAEGGRLQLATLLRLGLSRESRVVDIGCGVLRAGYWLIHFLEPGRYCGLEPHRGRLELGLNLLLEPGVEAVKRPRFDFNDEFDTSVFRERFDFFLARSIWTHASKAQIRRMLDGFVRDRSEAGVFLTSFLPASAEHPDHEGAEWVGTSHRSDVVGVIGHALAWIEEECAARGLRVSPRPEDDFQEQQWLVIR